MALLNNYQAILATIVVVLKNQLIQWQFKNMFWWLKMQKSRSIFRSRWIEEIQVNTETQSLMYWNNCIIWLWADRETRKTGDNYLKCADAFRDCIWLNRLGMRNQRNRDAWWYRIDETLNKCERTFSIGRDFKLRCPILMLMILLVFLI